MFRLILLFSLILQAAVSFSQAASPSTQTETSSTVAPSETIITVHGACETADGRIAGSCNESITKEQFEKLIAALNSSNQTISPVQRRSMAQSYVELMALSKAAIANGTEKDPDFQMVMRLVRMRTLADIYRRELEQQYRNPPAQEIDAYYRQNLPKFEEIKLSRIFIPAKNPAAANKDDYDKKATEVAQQMHDRAARGEDMEKLQKEAYTSLGLTVAPPTSAVGARRRGMQPRAEEDEFFALSPGQVSKVKQEPAGYLIFRLESKQTLPVDQVKDEISRELFRQKMDKELKAATESVKADFNDKYFGAAEPAKQPNAGAQPK